VSNFVSSIVRPVTGARRGRAADLGVIRGGERGLDPTDFGQELDADLHGIAVIDPRVLHLHAKGPGRFSDRPLALAAGAALCCPGKASGGSALTSQRGCNQSGKRQNG
jgi:hypothetical protein